MSDLKERLRGVVNDGVLLGMKMAMETLRSAKPHVSAENQTWDSAICILDITRSEYEARAILSSIQDKTDD